MSDSRFDSINTTLAELRELMDLIEKHSPEVPPILCKIVQEKAVQLCAEVEVLNTVIEPVVVSPITERETSGREASLPDTETEVKGSSTNKSFLSFETDTSSEVEAVEEKLEEPQEPEKKSENTFPFSWDVSEDDFCLFDRVPEMNVQNHAGKENLSVSTTEFTEEPSQKSPDVDTSKLEIEEKEQFISEEHDTVSAPEIPLKGKFSEQNDNEQESFNELVSVVHKRLQEMMSLNDKFLFRRELFDSDDEYMNQTLEALNKISSYEASLAYLQNHFSWDFESETVELLRMLLKQRFE